MTHRALPILVLIATVAACGGDDKTDGILSLDGDVDAGAVLYAADCAVCHGADALGTDDGPDLVRELHHSDAALLQYMLYGDGEMPAYEDVYTDQDFADVLAWLRDQG